MSLMYNTENENLYTHSQIAMMPTPPAKGRFHRPVPFSDYLDEVKMAFDKNGLVSVNEEYAVSNDQNRLFGLMEVQPAIEGELITADEWRLLVGVRGSHDQKISRGLTLGSQVLVCSNLCFSGDLGTFKTKQTLQVWDRLPHLINEAVQRVPEMAHRQQLSFDRYKEVELKPRHGDAALVELHRREALTAAQLSRAIQEWDEPTHEEHSQWGRSVWRLFNAATEAQKPTGATVNHELVQGRTMKISHFLDEVVGL